MYVQVTRLLCCLVFLAAIGCIPQASAATRLGLFVTQEELNIWRARMTDTVGTINGFTYQSIYQNRIKAPADAFVAQTQPGGDGYWTGYTGGGCMPEGTSGPGRKSGQLMASAAFVYLLTGTTSYAADVKTNLLAMAANPNLDFTNRSKYCIYSGYQNGVELNNWKIRMILMYDYLIAGGYVSPAVSGGFTTAEQTTMRTWLAGLPSWEYDSLKTASTNGLYSYNGLFNSPPTLTCSSNCTASNQAWYYGGHLTAGASENLFNTVATSAMNMVMLTGILTNNATRIADATNWIKGIIATGVNNIGMTSQHRRWGDCSPPCPGGAWGHACGVQGALVQAADALARTGNTTLYTYTASTVVPGSPAGTVSLFLLLEKFAKLANSTEPEYAIDGGAQSREISWDTDVGTGLTGNYYDFVSMAANIFYHNSDIRTAMTRASIGSNNYVSMAGCNDDQSGGCFSGSNSWWPDLPFMLGNLDSGQINPYNLTASGPPAVTITAPTSSPTFTTGTTPLTTLAGTASDDVGVLSVTWSCPTCTPTSGTATCATCGASATAPAWSVASLGLATGANVVTVTATDADTQTGVDTLTVTRTAAAGPVARYPFEGSANDSTGNGHTGTLQGGATATAPGQTGLGLTLDGVNDYVSIADAADLNITGDVTIAFWANLTAAGHTDVVLTKDGSGPAYNVPYQVEIENSGAPHYAWLHNTNANWTSYFIFTAYTVPLNTWHRVVVTRTQATKVLSLYVNGQLQQTITGWTNDAGTNTQGIWIGTDGALDPARFLAGKLDDVMLEPRVWTVSEIQADGQLLAPLLLRVVR
jgi:Concanavalin A-like lectin/glucanases superfamily